MKITKRYLKQLIKEELAYLREYEKTMGDPESTEADEESALAMARSRGRGSVDWDKEADAERARELAKRFGNQTGRDRRMMPKPAGPSRSDQRRAQELARGTAQGSYDADSQGDLDRAEREARKAGDWEASQGTMDSPIATRRGSNYGPPPGWRLKKGQRGGSSYTGPDHRKDGYDGGYTPGPGEDIYTPGPEGPEVEYMQGEPMEITGRRRKIASDETRKLVNSMFKKGEIDKNTWRRARRALYKPDGDAKARQIVKSGRLDKWKSARRGRRPAGPTPGGYADLASGGTYVKD